MATAFQFKVPAGETWVFCSEHREMDQDPLTTTKLWMDDDHHIIAITEEGVEEWSAHRWYETFSSWIVDTTETDCCGPWENNDEDSPYVTFREGDIYFECSVCAKKYEDRDDAEGCC